MPKIKYHCDICDYAYYTEEKARICESLGINPFLFEVGDVLEPKSRMLKPEEAMNFQPRDVVIEARSRYPQNHENIYVVPNVKKEAISVAESYLKDNYIKVGKGGLRD